MVKAVNVDNNSRICNALAEIINHGIKFYPATFLIRTIVAISVWLYGNILRQVIVTYR